MRVRLFDRPVFARLCNFYKDKTGVEFSYFKQNTICRRLERERVSIANPDEYLARLKQNVDEANALFRNLLIYLVSHVQQRVLSDFHFGLKNQSVLFF